MYKIYTQDIQKIHKIPTKHLKNYTKTPKIKPTTFIITQY